MGRSVIRTTVPSTELVTSADMSPMLHSYPVTEESFLTMTIAAARDLVEAYTGYSLAPSNFIQYADMFPLQGGFRAGMPFIGIGILENQLANQFAYLSKSRSPFELELMRNPGLAITKIEYVDLNGVLQTLLPDTDFTADLTSIPARVMPLPGKLWPIALRGPKAVAIYYTAGYYTNATQLTTETQPRAMGCPPQLKAIVMALTEKWFINRNNYGEVPNAIWGLILSNSIINYNPGIE
jgi:hypothetical protein